MISANPSQASQARRHEIGEKLGNRHVPTHVVRVGTGPEEGALLAGARLQKSHGLSSDEVADLVHCGRLLAHSPHPNLARALQPVVGNDEVLLLWELIDGESMDQLCAQASGSGTRIPLEIWLRVLLDVLAGLQALHAVPQSDGSSAGFFHGEVTPSNIVVGIDGVARLIHTIRIPGLCVKVAGARPYLAPEILLQESQVDHRADVYSAGVILWEAVSGARLFGIEKTSTIVRRMLEGSLPHARPKRGPRWASKLSPIADGALILDRAGRFQSAEAMGSKLAAAARAHVASHVEVSRWVCGLAGELVMARRQRHGGHPVALPAHAARASPRAALGASPVSDPSVRTESVDCRSPHSAPAPVSERPARIRRAWVSAAALMLTIGVIAIWRWFGPAAERGGNTTPSPASVAHVAGAEKPVASGDRQAEGPARPPPLAQLGDREGAAVSVQAQADGRAAETNGHLGTVSSAAPANTSESGTGKRTGASIGLREPPAPGVRAGPKKPRNPPDRYEPLGI
ncbi:MAG: protein kinase [Polyangiaceae bacterium]|nr:protein kinase [Polyangiaceae bacterium]